MFLTAVSSVREGLTSAFSTVASDMTGAITDMVPVVAPIAGAILVVGIGIRVFKRFSK